MPYTKHFCSKRKTFHFFLKCILFTSFGYIISCNSVSSTGKNHQNDTSTPICATPSINPSGNRFFPGTYFFKDSLRVVTNLPDTITWITAVADKDNAYAVLSCKSGYRTTLKLVHDSIEETSRQQLPTGSPELVCLSGQEIKLFRQGSNVTHPVKVGDDVIWVRYENDRFIIPPNTPTLPDARLAVASNGTLVSYAIPTQDYTHGVLGDSIEAKALYISNNDSLVYFEGERVAEGLGPILADMDGDGTEEIIVTVSDKIKGARPVVYSLSGKLIASGPAIGTGYRWRHQIATAQFFDNGPREIVFVKTPHIGGVVEYFSMNGDSLVLNATRSGYSTHRIGSRNLDMALVCDITGDSFPELIVPSPDFSSLHALQRNESGVEDVREFVLPGILTSNLMVCATSEYLYLLAGVGNDLHIFIGHSN